MHIINIQPKSAEPVSQDRRQGAPDANPRFITDERGVILHATRGLAARLGSSESEMRGRPLSTLVEFCEPDEVFHAGGMFGADNSYVDSIREGTHLVEMQAAPGETMLMRFDRVRGTDGRKFLVGSLEDGAAPAVDDLQRDIEALLHQGRRSTDANGVKISAHTDEAELRHFLNMSNDVMAVCGFDGTFMRVNSTFNELLGYTDAQLLKMSFIDVVHVDDRAQVRAGIDNLRAQNGPQGHIVDFEARVLTTACEIRWIEWRQKREHGLIYSVGRDVTTLKNHQAAWKNQSRQLSEAQSIGHIGHWNWAVGTDDIDFSDEIFRIFGVDKNSFSPTLDNMNAMLHRRDVGRLVQGFQRAIMERNNYEMEFRVHRPGGEIRHIRCQGRCELDASGDVSALFGVMQDVTERNLYERDLKHAKEAAERAYAAKSQFLANMSHELRTPLNAIIGFSEMMQRQLLGPIGTERYLDYIAGIRESGEHLLDLISDILDMSKIEAGKYELDLEELNAGRVIRLAVHMIEGRAHDARINLSVEVENNDMLVVADRRALMQILLNLLSNAVKFTPANGAVKVICSSRPDNFLIRVEDTGIGIPSNKLSFITRPFEQVSNHYTREHEGTGLGLSITKELAELHGGALFVESKVGEGTAVTVRLPYNAYEHVKARKKKLL